MKTIFLIGFMGSGKTTVGKALSAALKLPVFDTDEEIVCNSGKEISQIFEENGESAFRLLEAEMLKNLTMEDSIITTGGGVILRKDNREWLKQNGLVIFLDAAPSEILKRLSGDQTRPLLKADKQTQVIPLLEYRMPYYLDTAHIRIETTGKPVETVVEEIIKSLK